MVVERHPIAWSLIRHEKLLIPYVLVYSHASWPPAEIFWMAAVLSGGWLLALG